MRLTLDLTPRPVAVDDGQLAYVAQGEGRPSLLVHGSLCDYRYWAPQLRTPLPEVALRALSLRHCWPVQNTSGNLPWTVAQHASDLGRALDEWQWPQVDLVGHSRGARVALAFALQHPKRIRSLVLADPALPLSEAPASDPAALAADRIEAGEIEAGLQVFVDTVNGADTWRRMIPDFRRMALDNAATLVRQAKEERQLPEDTALATLTCPVMLIGGEASPERYHRSRTWLAERMTAAPIRRVVIPAAAHGMNLARPHAFNEALQAFWRCVPASDR